MGAHTNSQGRRRPRWHYVLGVVVVLAVISGGAFWRYGRPLLHGVEAYVYAFPLVLMDLSKEQMTATTTVGQFTAPENQFAVMTHYPNAEFRLIPRTGLDALFATAWVDLQDEPMVLSVPDTSDRYYVIALFDMWTNVFGSIGKRTTGTKSGNFLIAGPGWVGTKPDDVQEVYQAPTRYVWVNAQMQADGEKDFAVVNALQTQYKLTPLSAWGSDYTPPQPKPIGDKPGAAMATLEAMDAGTFYSRFATLMKENPPAAEDAPMLAKLSTLGIEPGKDFDISKVASLTAWGLEKTMRGYELLQKGVALMKTHNGWLEMPSNIAKYGTDYQTRAGIAAVGLGAVWPEDVIYPVAFKDGDGKEFDSAQNYVLHFDKDLLPPTNATWSVSIYDPDGFYVANSIDRFHIAPWMPLKTNEDGSLDIYIQSSSPGSEKEANWLPSPRSGTFNLVVRDFWPDKSMLDGTYRLPPVTKVK